MLRRLATGLIAGSIGTLAMDSSQATIVPAIRGWVTSHRSDSVRDAEGRDSNSPEETRSAPARVAKRGAGLLGVELNDDEAKAWGIRLHWLHGLQFGVLYQVLVSRPSARNGLAYGAALWLLSDELLLWALGVTKAPTDYPASEHVSGLASHAIYGIVVGIAAKGLSRT